MEVYDKNGNGTIEFDEFKSIVSIGTLLGHTNIPLTDFSPT